MKARRIMRPALLAAGATGLILGATVLTPQRARAFGLGDIVLLIQAVQTVGTDVTTMQNALSGKLQSVQTYINNQLGDGFTQLSNYMKGQVGATQQIVDASNQANAIVNRQMADAQIVQQHVVTPQTCDSLTNGQSIVAAGNQAAATAAVIANIQNARDQAQPGTPSYNGMAQGIASINKLHYSLYCSANDASAGECQETATPDADQDADSILGQSTFDGQTGLNTANNFATVLIQPVAPAAIRGSQLASNAGQNAIIWRRHYNAEMSLARQVVSDIIAQRTPTVTLTTAQRAELAAEGQTVVTTASWLEALELDANRRESNIQWHANLVAEPPASVQREIAVELAQSNYIAVAQYRLSQQTAMIEASLLADTAQHQLQPPSSIPIPTVASN
ncbi:MAG: hypothetical protein PHT60_14900 [Acidiphilium sp.]|nr:hypothetical protein [Acidiphilium sp.]MDD4937050.1 hypothetical protein [Acidiphilium sp.]